MASPNNDGRLKKSAKENWKLAQSKIHQLSGIELTETEVHHAIKVYGGDDGQLDDLEILMMKYDTDRSGTFDIAEVKAIISDMDKKTKEANSLRKKLHVVIFVAFGICSLLLGLMVGSNELSKENHTIGGNLVDGKGAAVKTSQVRSVAHMLDIPKLAYDEMKFVKDVTFKLKNSEDVIFMDVVGFTKSSEHSVVLHSSGYVRNLFINCTTAIFKEVNKPDKTVDTPPKSTRRLKQVIEGKEQEEQLIFANEQEMTEHHYGETHDGRKLGFFSALMTSGSFMMMQAGAF